MFLNICRLLLLSALVSGFPTVDLLSSIDSPPETLASIDKEFVGQRGNINIDPFLTNYLLQSLAQESEQKRRFQRIRDLNDLQAFRYSILNKYN